MQRSSFTSVQMWSLEMHVHVKATAARLSGLTVGKSGSIWAPWSVMSIFSSPWLQRTESRDAPLRFCQTQVEDEVGLCDFFSSPRSVPSPPLQFTGRVFSNGGSTAFPFLPYIIYARRREVALPFTRVSEALRAHMAAPCAPLSSDNHFKSYMGLCALGYMLYGRGSALLDKPYWFGNWLYTDLSRPRTEIR